MKKIKTGDMLLRFVYPDRCISCLKPVIPGRKICDECEKGLELILDERCPSCFKPLDKCKCKRPARYFSRAVAPFEYDDRAKSIVWHWKFEGNLDATDFLSSSMFRAVKALDESLDFDLICYIPQTESEKAEKNFNQSKLLAECLSTLTGIELSDCLVKTRNTLRQHTLPSFMKSGNVFGCFECTESVANKRILLVDDILTSGNTMNECAKMLDINDAREVVAVAFACAGAKS